MPEKYQESMCRICGKEIFACCSAYKETPFVDGRCYAEMCHACSEVPKMIELDEKVNEWIVYKEMSPKRLCSVKEIMSGGWTRQEAELAIKAVKKAIAKGKKP